jgi:RNA polymerase sigma factor (sigma-70 family)
VNGAEDVGTLLRALAPQVLGILVRRHRQFDICEDAVQDALITASGAWSTDGVPNNPRGWLLTVAERRVIDHVRSERSREAREQRYSANTDEGRGAALADNTDEDDTLALLIMCCHPVLSPATQIALTLRAVGGLTTAEIAAAFFVPEATMAQRISRAKAAIRNAGEIFGLPHGDELEERLAAVMHVLYLMFTEGHTAVAGDHVNRPDLSDEAIRLTRELLRQRGEHAETEGLLALMLLTDARRPARTTPAGELVLLADQERTLWRRDLIDEGEQLVTGALERHDLGPYQLQAAIAALHDQADSDDATDWLQILALYDILDRVAPNPTATLSRAIAQARVLGPEAGVATIQPLLADPAYATLHRLHSVHAYLLELGGDIDGAKASYLTAARLTTSVPGRRSLLIQASRCARPPAC